MYEISDYAESPDVEYPAVPPKQSFNSLSQHNANVAASSASYASLNYNGKVRVSAAIIIIIIIITRLMTHVRSFTE